MSLAFRCRSVPELLSSVLATMPADEGPHAGVIRSCRADFDSGRSIHEAYARLKRETFDPIRARDPED